MIRLRKTRWKVAYILVGVVLLFVLNGAVYSFKLPGLISEVVADFLTVSLYFGGVRSFRGAGEPIEAPRAWWRMTSRPRAGFVMGSLLVLGFATNIFSAFTGPRNSIVSVLLGSAVNASLAFLYIRSSIRLRREPPRMIHEVPRWKPLRS